jgi:hypothetical protein
MCGEGGSGHPHGIRSLAEPLETVHSSEHDVVHITIQKVEQLFEI